MAASVLRHWVLVGQTPIECDMWEWAMFMETGQHILWQDVVSDSITVSTVFLGIDHSFSIGLESPDHVPELFETMVFSDHDPEHISRWRSYLEAKNGHEETVAEFSKP